MTWIGIRDRLESCYGAEALDGLPTSARHAGVISPDELTVRGTLTAEIRLATNGRPQPILGYRRMHPWPSELSLQALPGGGVALVIRQGGGVYHASLGRLTGDRPDVIRVSYSWDAPARFGRLSLELPDTGRAFTSQVAAPPPLPTMELRAMILGTHSPLRPAGPAPAMTPMLDPDVIFVALSDAIEPIGPSPTLTASVPIQTAWGPRPAGQVRRGDLVILPGTQSQIVLHKVARRVPARGTFQPVRLRAPYFGLRQDIVVSGDQRLVMSGSDVEYMFGAESVLVPARHLLDGVSALPETGAWLARYVQFVLPRHDPVTVDGLHLESLYVGRLRRNRNRLEASILNGLDRNLLPEHASAALPVLRPFEAITLEQHRAA